MKTQTFHLYQDRQAREFAGAHCGRIEFYSAFILVSYY